MGQAFLKYCGNEDFKTIKHQGTHRIAFLVESQENSRNFSKIQENSTKFSGRIVVRIELVLFEIHLCHVVSNAESNEHINLTRNYPGFNSSIIPTWLYLNMQNRNLVLFLKLIASCLYLLHKGPYLLGRFHKASFMQGPHYLLSTGV